MLVSPTEKLRLAFMKRYETIAEGSIFTRAGADVRLRNTMLIRRAGGID